MKWVVIAFMVYHGQPMHRMDQQHQFSSQAQCEQWLASLRPEWATPEDVQAGWKAIGATNLVYGCKLVGDM